MIASNEDQQQQNDGSMSIVDHISELRKRLMIMVGALFLCFLVCFYFAQPIYNFLAQPLVDAWNSSNESDNNRRMIATALHEQFFTQIKVAFFASFCLSFPIIINQIWVFIAPGLYKNEKRAFLPFLIATPLLFALGAVFVYYLVLPVAWEFFISFEQRAENGNVAIALEPKVNEYLSLVMQLIFAFGLCFELPVVLTLLVKIGITSAQGLRTKRRYAIVLAFVAAAILTPPDPLSQIGLAVPIILLYELSIFASSLIEKKREKQQNNDDTIDDDETENADSKKEA